MAAIVTLIATYALTACGGGAAAVDNGKISAIQTALDTRRHPTANLLEGQICRDLDEKDTRDSAAIYKQIPGAHVVSNGKILKFGRMQNCSTVAWDGRPKPAAGTMTSFYAPVGHWVVDKIGEDADGPMGIKTTPYKAHIVMDKAHEAMFAASLIVSPKEIADGQAVLHKDADGKWIATL